MEHPTAEGPSKRGIRRRDVLAFAGPLGVGAMVVAGRAPSAAAASTTLTLWENYGTEINATATRNLAKAFAASHPGIVVKVVSQPADNYFALLTAAVIARRAPDLAVMWTGLFTLKYKHLLADLTPLLPAATLKEMTGLKWSAAGFDPARGVYVVPLEDQFYIGFTNKALLRKAGLSGPPRTWSELETACAKLKAAGITPLLYGSGSQNLNAEFYPYYDLSYLMAGIYTLPEWKNLYDGTTAWTSPAIVAQVKRWVALRTKGFTNANVLTTNNTITRFARGEAAMIVKGNWNLQQLYDTLGADLGVFVPPYSEAPMKAVIQYPGDGFAIMRTSTHKQEAAAFLNFVMSVSGQKIIAEAGLVPDRVGFPAANPLYHELLGLTGRGYTAYPMLDNVIQPSVVDVGSKVLTAAFAGQMTADAALGKMQAALMALPAAQRGADYS